MRKKAPSLLDTDTHLDNTVSVTTPSTMSLTPSLKVPSQTSPPRNACLYPSEASCLLVDCVSSLTPCKKCPFLVYSIKRAALTPVILSQGRFYSLGTFDKV